MDYHNPHFLTSPEELLARLGNTDLRILDASLNLHYDELLIGSRFKSADELGKALGKKGLLDAERVIAYCGGGISATIDAFACLLIGKEAVAVYDGSMAEWVRDSLPLVTGLAPNGDWLRRALPVAAVDRHEEVR